jgi:5'-phosphate synthase pdxT subunit
MKIAILAVQGAFAEHAKCVQALGAEPLELRQRADVLQSYDGLILPGGESTVQEKLLKELDMFEPLQTQIEQGLPVLATCAGLILLAKTVSNDDRRCFHTLPVTVRRNAYGRQLGSFHTVAPFGDLGDIPMTFIRAPYIESVEEGVTVLATVDHNIVAVRYQNQTAVAFHPELDTDLRIHEAFLKQAAGR